MKKLFKFIVSLLVLAIITVAAVDIYNSDSELKKQVDGIFDTTEEIIGETTDYFNNQIIDAATGNTNGTADSPTQNGDKPAVPVDTKITSSTNENGSQQVVEPVIAKEDLESVWGDVGAKGLSVYEYGKSLLNEDEKKSYIIIIGAIQNVDKSVKIKSSITPDQIKKVYSYVLCDHAEIFYIKGVSLKYSSSGNSYSYEFEFEYGYDANKATIIAMRNSMNQKALEIVESVGNIKTDLKKEKAIHDKVIKSCSYDVDAVENPQDYPDSCSAYGVLIKGKAICQGYAQAMKILLSSCGIKTLYVTGKAKGDGHAWNMVNVGGKWKYLDATFDDPVFVDKKGEYVSYNTVSYTYFNFTSNKDHELGVFMESDPFYKNSENYKTMPALSD